MILTSEFCCLLELGMWSEVLAIKMVYSVTSELLPSFPGNTIRNVGVQKQKQSGFVQPARRLQGIHVCLGGDRRT